MCCLLLCALHLQNPKAKSFLYSIRATQVKIRVKWKRDKVVKMMSQVLQMPDSLLETRKTFFHSLFLPYIQRRDRKKWHESLARSLHISPSLYYGGDGDDTGMGTNKRWKGFENKNWISIFPRKGGVGNLGTYSCKLPQAKENNEIGIRTYQHSVLDCIVRYVSAFIILHLHISLCFQSILGGKIYYSFFAGRDKGGGGYGKTNKIFFCV